jgi:sulfur relay (sulfurtransferase) DsrC/TusE family protein
LTIRNGELIVAKNNMKLSKKDKSYDECMEIIMTPAQREVFLIVDEWWKKFGFSPSLRDIAHQRGKMGLGNTSEIVDRLVKVGALKKLKNKGRSIRPVYINFRNLE